MLSATRRDVDAALEAAAWSERGDWGQRAPIQTRDAAFELEGADRVDRATLERSWSRSRCARRAGRCANGLAEVREAVDSLALLRRANPRAIRHRLRMLPLGPVVVVHQSVEFSARHLHRARLPQRSPPGNAVLAKPAEQTAATAALVVAMLREAGIAPDALQLLLPGEGERVGARLVADERVRGVVFTGSTDAARSIARVLARRGEVPLIAETGGQNAMIVDSTALPEQVVTDVLRSAFDSAGQRCSALRVLCLQQIAAATLRMLEGAMAELRVGNPALNRNRCRPVDR